MNWRSTVQRVKEELHRFGSTDADTVKRAICRSILFYRDFHLSINEGTYDITLVANQHNYGEESTAAAADGYPADMLKPLNMAIIVDDYTYPPMHPLSIKAFRKRQKYSGTRGYPREYTILNEEILINPPPNSAYVLRLDYIADLGTPVATYSGTAWSYTVGGTTISETYTNNWFTDGEDLITERAKTIILGSNYKDLEAAQASRMLENEYLENLIVKSEKGQYPAEAEPWV